MHQKSRVAMAVAVLSSALSTLATIAQAQSISIPGLRAFRKASHHEAAQGGHFAAFEQPDLFVAELRKSLAQFR